MKSKACFVRDGKQNAFPISLFQDSRKKFTVVYGADRRKHLSYSQAATQLGLALLHCLACEGKINND